MSKWRSQVSKRASIRVSPQEPIRTEHNSELTNPESSPEVISEPEVEPDRNFQMQIQPQR